MKRILPLLFLTMSLPLFAQTNLTLGAGACNTSPANNSYCVAISVAGIGTPGYTWMTFWTNGRTGAFTQYWTTIADDYTGQTLFSSNASGGSLTGNASGSAVSGTAYDPTQNMTFTFSGGMQTIKTCGRYCVTHINFTGGSGQLD